MAGSAPRRVGLILVVVVAGLALGSLLGELAGALLPAGRIQEILTSGPTIGLRGPATFDLRALSVTFGVLLKVNVVGVAGVAIAALVLRRL